MTDTEYWKQSEAARMRIERRQVRKMRVALKAMCQLGADNVARGVADAPSIPNLRAILEPAMYELYLDTISTRLPVLLDYTEQLAKAERTWLPAFVERYATQLFNQAAEKIAGICEYTQDLIRDSIGRSVLQELGTDKAARALMRDLSSSAFSIERCTTIVRTETTAASSKASIEAVKLTGVKMKKKWIAARDARTRDTHKHLDGVVVDMDADFVTDSGIRMIAPGQPVAGQAGTVKEVVNCRCVVGYVRE